MKKKRQAQIINIIKTNNVNTQEQLQKLLLEHGFDVTQATISRDIKELRLVKESTDNDGYCYSIGSKPSVESKRNRGIIADSIISVDCAMNIVCIKCFTGMANAACATIDSMDWSGLVGTIAGDDTIFVLCKTVEYATVFKVNMEKILNAKNS